MLGGMRSPTILVPTDLSAEGERALGGALELARTYGGRVILLHVVEDMAVSPKDKGKAGGLHTPGAVQEGERTRKELEEKRRALPPGIDVTVDVRLAPSVPHAIVDYAVEKGCDLIALSTHGRTGFKRLIVGSVAEAVLRASPVPILAWPRQS